MKRDMDLVRQILLRIEQAPPGQMIETAEFPQCDRETVGYHFELLDDAGLLLCKGVHGEVTGACADRGGAGNLLINPRLSWEGCEFIDKVRDDGVWNYVKGKVAAFGDVPIAIFSAVAIDYIKSKLGVG
jgi:hypothetical protein